MRRLLDRTDVHRGGRTAKFLALGTKRVWLTPHGFNSSVGKTVGLSFSIDSKGGGTTEVYVDIHEGDFAHVIDALVEASPSSALPVMAAAIARRLAAQPEHDAKVREEARAALVAEAKKNLDLAPSDGGELERVVHRGVRKLAEDLREAEKPKSDEEAAE